MLCIAVIVQPVQAQFSQPSTSLTIHNGSLLESAANTLVVTTLVDESDGSCIDDDCSLRDAVAAAASGDTISFGALSGPSNLSLGEILIDKSLSILGPGSAMLEVNGSLISRIFNITAGVDVTISGLTLTNSRHNGGLATSQGGAIYNAGTLVLEDMRFLGNAAIGANGTPPVPPNPIGSPAQSGEGGAIYNLGSLVIRDSSFTGNLAIGGSSGDIFFPVVGSAYGGAIYNAAGASLEVENSLFNQNLAAGGSGSMFGGFAYGGAVSDSTTPGDSGIMSFTNTTFSSNTVLAGNGSASFPSNAYGGAIYAFSIYTTLDYVTIINNAAAGALGVNSAGGGIYSGAGMTGGPVVQGSLVANNTAGSGPDIAQSIESMDYNLISNASGAILGGTIENSLINITPLLDTTLKDNGGLTMTHALPENSHAVDMGGSNCPPTDARGVTRPKDGDGDGEAVCDIGAFELSINTAPILTSIEDKTVNEGSEMLFTIPVVDQEQDVLTFTLHEGPAGAVLDPATGVFSWTPGEADGPHYYDCEISISDGQLTITGTLGIDVKEVNIAPVLDAIGSQKVTVGKALEFTAAAADADLPANTLTFSLGTGAPEGAAIDPVSGAFTWTPGSAGDFTVTIIVSDGTTTDSEPVAITVNPIVLFLPVIVE
jgi:CSLREA domain-containing protein